MLCFTWVYSPAAHCNKGYCIKKVLKSLGMTLIRAAYSWPSSQASWEYLIQTHFSISDRNFPFEKSQGERKGRGWEGSLSEVRLICLQLVWGAQRHESSQRRVHSLILNRWVVRVFVLARLQWMSDLNGEGAGGAARRQSSVSGCHRQRVLSSLWVAERGWWTQLPRVWVQRETLGPGTWGRRTQL